MGFRNQFGGWGGGKRVDEVWNLGKMISQLATRSVCMLVSVIFKQHKTLLLFPVFWANFRTQGMFSSSDEVYDVSISWNYILWAWRIISVWENQPKLKETMVNYFAFKDTSRLESVHVRTVSQYNNTPESYGLLLYLLLNFNLTLIFMANANPYT